MRSPIFSNCQTALLALIALTGIATNAWAGPECDIRVPSDARALALKILSDKGYQPTLAESAPYMLDTFEVETFIRREETPGYPTNFDPRQTTSDCAFVKSVGTFPSGLPNVQTVASACIEDTCYRGIFPLNVVFGTRRKCKSSAHIGDALKKLALELPVCPHSR